MHWNKSRQTFAAAPYAFLRESVQSVSSRLQKCGQNGSVLTLTANKNCSDVAFRLTHTAILLYVFPFQYLCTGNYTSFFWLGGGTADYTGRIQPAQKYCILNSPTSLFVYNTLSTAVGEVAAAARRRGFHNNANANINSDKGKVIVAQATKTQ
jgi:hypothetical protein